MTANQVKTFSTYSLPIIKKQSPLMIVVKTLTNRVVAIIDWLIPSPVTAEPAYKQAQVSNPWQVRSYTYAK